MARTHAGRRRQGFTVGTHPNRCRTPAKDVRSAGACFGRALLEYLTGGPDWSLPIASQETDEGRAAAAESWQSNLALLDIGILSIVGDSDLDTVADAATQIVADALRDSLWERQLRHYDDTSAAAVRGLVYSRTKHLWQTSTPSERRGWFLAGLGADAGSKLSQVSGSIIALAGQAEIAILDADHESAAELLVTIADIVFAVEVFAPETALGNWHDVLRHWVHGLALSDVSGDRVAVAQFIEADVIYRLVWGMEAARVYEAAQGNPEADALLGTAVTAIETGTFNRAASILIRSGFDHRLAAISAVMSTGATFDSAAEMRQWINDLDPAQALSEDWPTPESRSAWETFVNPSRARRSRRWSRRTEDLKDATWYGTVPDPDAWLRVTDAGPDKIEIWSIGYDLLGEAAVSLNRERQGVLRTRRLRASAGVRLLYRGPGDLFPEGAEASSVDT